LLNGKVKFVLSFFLFFKGFEGNVGDKDRIMEEKRWPMDVVVHVAF